MITSTGTIASSAVRKQLITSPTGFIHSLVMYGNNKLIAASRDMTGNQKFIRFNNKEDLTDQTVISIYSGVSQMFIVGDDAYLCYYSAANDYHLRIGKVDLLTMTLTMPIDEIQPTYYPYYSCHCTDGTYMYVACAGGLMDVFKYRLSDMVKVGTTTATAGKGGRAHGILYHTDGFLYVTSAQNGNTAQGVPTKNWVRKIDPSTMTIVDENWTFPSTPGATTRFSDDFCVLGDYIYVAFEYDESLLRGNILIMEKDNLANYTIQTVPELGNLNGLCYGSFSHGGFIYYVWNHATGFVTKLDPTTNTIVKTVALPAGEAITNELAFDDNGQFFITFWANPAKVAKYSRLFN